MLYFRIVSQSLHIIIRSGQIIVPRAFERQQFFPRLSFILDIHARIGFTDYKAFIRSATDNPFLLYYKHFSKHFHYFQYFFYFINIISSLVFVLYSIINRSILIYFYFPAYSQVLFFQTRDLRYSVIINF